eukprot:TRINITY_DN1507_c0_g1_i1.p2 TRINITY_DN1507_c0_g1~~TRINITY_DN1507_c0_g1_i1.p2  ORF type:complete len:197 (+),score=86.42 TRINITY_DN1507_c0_g1_i1:36-593(+)
MGIPKKQLAAVKKEGGKKAQDLVGMSELGGINFFHVTMNECEAKGDEGPFDRLAVALAAMNVEVDEKADDRKGGAGNLGKILLSAGKDRLAVLMHVPEELAKKHDFDADEWLTTCLKSVDGVIVGKTEEGWTKAESVAGGEKFPLKERDVVIGAGFDYLKAKGLVLDESSDDDYVNYAEVAGVEW